MIDWHWFRHDSLLPEVSFPYFLFFDPTPVECVEPPVFFDGLTGDTDDAGVLPKREISFCDNPVPTGCWICSHGFDVVSAVVALWRGVWEVDVVVLDGAPVRP